MSVRKLGAALALLGSAALFLPLASLSAQAGDNFKALRLSNGNLAGERAVAALGKDLPRIAAHYDLTAVELRRMLLDDKSLRVARDGRLFYVEDPRQVPPPRRAAEDPILNGALLPLEQTFSLHSKPGATRYLILNFQGKTVTNSTWNTTLQKPSIVATPFTLDANTANFSDAERIAIQQMWQRVAEDFAAFDVDVTTDTSIAEKAPATSYATAVITRQSDYGFNAPGVAYTGTFGIARYEPAWVAYDTLYKNPKYIAEAISHELGHRLGLSHDGTRSEAYYAGQGTAPMRWAPIMGNSYLANISQFSKGEYQNANNTQDDFAVMSRFLPFRADSAGPTNTAAVPLAATATNGRSTGSVTGAIELQGDTDLYAVTAGTGPLTATVTPAALGPDANLALALVGEDGTVLASSTQNSALSGTITFNLTRAGTYYLRVGSRGFGAAQTTGFSDYGSRGLYRLTASFAAPGGVSTAAK